MGAVLNTRRRHLTIQFIRLLSEGDGDEDYYNEDDDEDQYNGDDNENDDVFQATHKAYKLKPLFCLKINASNNTMQWW